MTHTINESQLQLIALQVNSILEDYSRKSSMERLAYRFQTEFVGKNLIGKARFLRSVVHEGVHRVGHWVAKPRSRKRHPRSTHEDLWVAAICNGGMGDLTIYSALLDRFYRECGFPTIHAVVHPLRVEEAEFVFHRSPSVKLVTPQADLDPSDTPYDVIVRLGDFLSYDFIRSERVGSVNPEVLQRLSVAQQIQKPYQCFIRSQPSFDGLFASIAAQSGLRRLDVLGWLGNLPFTQDHLLYTSPQVDACRHMVDDLGLAHRPYITIHNGWDAVAHRHTETATKAWPERHYHRFVESFKAKHPDILVIQLGAKTSKPIANVDLCLVNRTSLHEVAWVLKHSLLHVDGDSGLVHLARALHTKSLVLFGPTNHEFFRYESNETLSSSNCHNCWWSQHFWMRSCPRGLAEPECMQSIDPAAVLDIVEKHLTALPAWAWEVEVAHECRPAPAGGNGDGTTGGHPRHVGHIIEALKSIGAFGQDLRVAVLNPAESLTHRMVSEGLKPATVFAFQPETESQRPGGGKAEWAYGSLHNIPAENEAYDVVVTPLITDRMSFPLFALKEFRRLLSDRGRLVLTFDFTSPSNGHETKSVDAFWEALQQTGVRGPLSRSSVGVIVLRKERNGLRALQRSPLCVEIGS